MIEIPKTLNCPFCGNETHIEKTDKGRYRLLHKEYVIGCILTPSSVDIIFSNPEILADLWNMRAKDNPAHLKSKILRLHEFSIAKGTYRGYLFPRTKIISELKKIVNLIMRANKTIF